MRRCLSLASYPLLRPRHGGQVRAASIARGFHESGWDVTTVGLYPELLFAEDERDPNDIVLRDAAVMREINDNMIFGDLVAARHAAAHPGVIATLADLLDRLRPDVIVVEQPWCWLPLQQAMQANAATQHTAIIYSSHNIEWRMRHDLYQLGLRRAGSDVMALETRALELDLCQRADLVLSISDSEAAEIAEESGCRVTYLPPSSDLDGHTPPSDGRFASEAKAGDLRYAALLGSAYWPNAEGFLDLFPDGLGFLRPLERIWVAGSLGPGLMRNIRYLDFQSINDSRLRAIGQIDDADKAAFFAAAACILVPVLIGGGSKLKTADAIASGRPVITTSHGIDGYGPIARMAVGQGIYIADTPREFQALVLRALREGLPGCPEQARAEFQQRRLSHSLAALLAGLKPGGPQHSA
jgi:glycosyltransferase involved in cell wall biosynthesis